MRTFLFLCSAMAVIGLAYWAYMENFKTQTVLSEVEQLQREISTSRGRLAVLRAEWAYLNRPDRLRDLADINFDPLGLLPLTPEQFGHVDQVAFPEPELPPITDPIETMAQTDGEAQ